MKHQSAYATRHGLFTGLFLATTLAATVVTAGTLQLIPSIGVSKSTDSNAGDPKASGGLALRAAILPFLKIEGGIAYREQKFDNADVKMRVWPVTASAWFSPLPMLYAGGGVGWYRTTIDYGSALPYEDRTSNQMGVHVGGGADIPIAPRLGLDLNGRYIFMQADNDLHVPTTFNPDFWSASVGLAINF